MHTSFSQNKIKKWENVHQGDVWMILMRQTQIWNAANVFTVMVGTDAGDINEMFPALMCDFMVSSGQ